MVGSGSQSMMFGHGLESSFLARLSAGGSSDADCTLLPAAGAEVVVESVKKGRVFTSKQCMHSLGIQSFIL